MAYDSRRTTKAFTTLLARQGGGLLFHRNNETYPDVSETYVVATNIPEGYKPFEISIYNSASDQSEATLRLIINPSDLQIGQVFLGNSSYTRGGWLSTLWGRQQPTMNASGISPACYITTSGFRRPVDPSGALTGTVVGGPLNEGLVNFNRRDSLSFINLQTLIAFFKNNASYVLADPKEKTMYKDRNRVINVMDSVLISYDNTEYIGSFNTFTLEESADKPYNFSYTFDFIVSGLRGDPVEGHVRIGNNNENSSVELAVQGDDTDLLQVLYMNAEQLNKEFKMDQKQLDEIERRAKEFQYTERAASEEEAHNGGNRIIDKNTCAITSTEIDYKGAYRPEHIGKIDYRTASGQFLSLTDGEVVQVKKGPDHYIMVRIKEDGVLTNKYLRYYHIDTNNPKERPFVSVGDQVKKGVTVIGSEHIVDEVVAYPGGNRTYDPHCDLELKEIPAGYVEGNWMDQPRTPVDDLFFNAIAEFNKVGLTDYQNIQYRVPEQVKNIPNNILVTNMNANKKIG